MTFTIILKYEIVKGKQEYKFSNGVKWWEFPLIRDPKS